LQEENKKHIEGIDRDQLTLMPDAIEDYIAEDNPVRFLDVFVEGLDLKSLGFPRVEPEPHGRPPYHPSDVLRLYLNGHSFQPRSRARSQSQSRGFLAA
jgi:transposase